MSLLAEPRRKQKISVDPQNLQWHNDTNAFGKRMLKQMGWQEGKGLGKLENGIEEHVKLKPNWTNRGLGSEGSTSARDNNWMAHQDEFSLLLSKLNAEKSNYNIQREMKEANDKKGDRRDRSARDPPIGINVHRKRQHFGLTSNDKNAIFGNTVNTQESSENDEKRLEGCKKRENANKIEKNEINFQIAAEKKYDANSATQTTSNISMDAYFAAKMAKRKAEGTNVSEGVKERELEEKDVLHRVKQHSTINKRKH